MIRHAAVSDYDEIHDIRKPYALDPDHLSIGEYRYAMQKSGFIGSMSPIKFQEDVHQLFLVDEDKSGILGYVRIDSDREYIDNDKKIWLSDQYKNDYFSEPHAEVGMIGVRHNAKRIGVGSGLLDYAAQLLQKKNITMLFSIVVISPLTNIPSIMMHEKFGFERVAVSVPHHHYDIENYQSILYMKQL